MTDEQFGYAFCIHYHGALEYRGLHPHWLDHLESFSRLLLLLLFERFFQRKQKFIHPGWGEELQSVSQSWGRIGKILVTFFDRQSYLVLFDCRGLKKKLG